LPLQFFLRQQGDCGRVWVSKSDISTILSANFLAYGCGQIINGLLTDRIGGKRAMLIGAAGTVTMNLLFGAASFWGLLSLFALLWGLNGYVQAFGAPGFIKINSAWFSEKQRGTFAGIFGFMINLGRLAANKLLPALLAGFTFLGMWHVPPQHWRWLFWIPAGAAAIMAVVLALTVKDTPEEVGYQNLFAGEADHADVNVRAESARCSRKSSAIRSCGSWPARTRARARCARASTSGSRVFFRRCIIST